MVFQDPASSFDPLFLGLHIHPHELLPKAHWTLIGLMMHADAKVPYPGVPGIAVHSSFALYCDPLAGRAAVWMDQESSCWTVEALIAFLMWEKEVWRAAPDCAIQHPPWILLVHFNHRL